MLNTAYLGLFLIYISYSILESNGDRVKDTMYVKINGSVACYRRMNSTHQIGCSSHRGGSVGIIHYCDKLADLQFILQNGSAGQYIPILPTYLFNADIVDLILSKKEKLAGLILHPNNDTLDYFSHENKCPNQEFNVDGTCPKNGWNPWGTGLLYRDIPFPMFYIEDENEVETIKECFQKFNNFSYGTQGDRSLCSLELNAFMYATTNTETCRRRSNTITNLSPVKLCDPLGDSNIWGSLFPLVEGPENETKPVKDFKYIVIAARLDTTSLFEKTSGAESPVTGVITLLMTAKLLKEMLPNRGQHVKKNVLFILFNGETYNYIGSQRLLYDMQRGEFPTDLPPNNHFLPTIYPENITLFIELSQLALGNATYAHYLYDSDLVTNFVRNLTRNNPSNSKLTPKLGSLPPSSLHTFIRGNTSVKGVVLTNHEKEYQNYFYNSLYDNASNIGYEYYNGSTIGEESVQKYVGDVAMMVAKSVFEEITGGVSYVGNVSVNLSLIDELFHCYLEDPNCRVHKAIQKDQLPRSPLSLYVGVTVVDNFFTRLVELTLAWFTGDMIGPSGPNCTNLHKTYVYRYYNMSLDMDRLKEMRCFRATVNITEALSPAFIIDDYDWSSNKYSSWSESTWNDMGMRMFLKPSGAHERMTLAIGSVTMVLSLLLVYFIKSRSYILFDFPIVEDPPANC